jgi:CRP-like cAMP-binding protein
MKVPGLFYNAKSFKDVPADTVIFEGGASGTEMFGVVEGEVEVLLPNGAVRTLGPGDTFGEMAIIDSSPRSGTAVAVAGAALNADLWDFCGARQGYRRLTQSAVQRLWPGFQGRVRGSARVAGSRYPG